MAVWVPTPGALLRTVALALLAQARVPACTPADRAAEHTQERTEPQTTSAPTDDPVRIKGLSPHLVIHRKHPAKVERLSADAMAKAGDLVQISYVAAGNVNGVILSLDDRGVVTLHHPPQLSGSSRLEPRGEQALSHAYELDDAEGFERFFFVTTGEQPTDVTAVVDAAHALAANPDAHRAALALPSPWHQSSLTLYKNR